MSAMPARTPSRALAREPCLVQGMHTRGWNQPTCSLATNVLLGMPWPLQGPPVTEVPEWDATASERGLLASRGKRGAPNHKWKTQRRLEALYDALCARVCSSAFPSREWHVTEHVSRVGRKGSPCSPNMKIAWGSFFLWNLSASLQCFQLDPSKQSCNKFIYSYNYWRRSYWVAMTVTEMSVGLAFMTLAFPWGTGQRTRSNNMVVNFDKFSKISCWTGQEWFQG